MAGTRRAPVLSDLWEPIMTSAPEKSLFVISIQGGLQFTGHYNWSYSDGETIQLNEGPWGKASEKIHVIQRSAIIAITTILPK